MTMIPRVGPLTLQSDYLSATAEFVLQQQYANLLLEQMTLDLPVEAGLAFEIGDYQERMKSEARRFNELVVPKYIEVITLGTNIVSLWNAIDLNLLREAYAKKASRLSCSRIFTEISHQAGLAHQSASSMVADLKVLSSTLEALQNSFDLRLEDSIKQLGEDAAADSAMIDELKAAIIKDIDGIIAGARKAGTAVKELFSGLLTTFKGVKADAGSDGSKDGESDEDGKGENGKKSGKFDVSTIHAAADGVAETEEARADLEADNEKLAAAYQRLSRANALIAVAKVVAVQNDMFISRVKEEVSEISARLAATWGQEPTPAAGSGGGISVQFANFSRQVEAISSQQDADQLANQLQREQPYWDALKRELEYVRSVMVSA